MDQNKFNSKDNVRKKLLERQGEARTVRRIVLIVCLVLILIIGGVGLGGFLYVNSAMKPVDPHDKTPKTVKIPIGSSVSSIGHILEKNDIIKSALVFKYYVKFNNESGFQAGDYDLTSSMSLKDIVTSLKKGKVMKQATLKLTIPEGLQIDQIADIIAKKTGMKQEDILKKLDEKTYTDKLMKEHPQLLTKEIYGKDIKHPLEGYLYPATYSFYEKKTTLNEIVEKMLDKTEETITPYKDEMKEKNVSPHKLLTMASLIEEEATQKADRHKISSVFYNRIKEKMPLQTDPTVLYALGKHKSRVLYEDLKKDSPYNTYVYPGLPPGPIASPGESSVEAAIHPAKTDDLYFLTDPKTGKFYYSKTLQEHNKNKAKYITNKN
ncbi:endolytic transglycosylase MltG [Falsibacillus albus]|uniref:Endolytic murein transglycosylase n=1 Tax=Falsibacillus albus TaxID=2478915 RepID=A0A3L7K514_9BACI|nr:endolytic transglycosylase MltG [Falsibacillus albus]RLQ98127.1 endolytic transglycosylase MltG [Falsibacillus albus]